MQPTGERWRMCLHTDQMKLQLQLFGGCFQNSSFWKGRVPESKRVGTVYYTRSANGCAQSVDTSMDVYGCLVNPAKK